MKKLFLVLLAGGIMFTACKKEKIETTNNNPLVLIKKNTVVDGFKGDLYLNKSYQQYIFKIADTKALPIAGKATGTLRTSTEETTSSCVVIRYICDGEPLDCYINEAKQIIITCE